MKSAEEIEEWLSTYPSSSELSQLFHWRGLLRTATYKEGFVASDTWRRAVVPSASGEELLRNASLSDYPEPDVSLALFGMFWHRGCLVDPAKTDVELVGKEAARMLADGELILPLLQGKMLYEKCNEIFPTAQDRMPPANWTRLTAKMPPGVYQSGPLVTGPLGVLRSRESRILEPRQSVGLWHCPSLDCQQLHAGTFVPAQNSVVDAYQSIETTASRLWGSSDRWHGPLRIWPATRDTAAAMGSDMLAFLGDCVVGEDRTRLLSRVFKSSNREYLQQGFSLKGDPDSLARSFGEAEQLQLLLLVDDITIDRLLDESVSGGLIDVPRGEVRRVERSRATSHYRTSC